MSDAAFHCMKASPKKLLPLTLIGIAVTSLLSVQPAQAYTVTLQQMGANVVATGTGAINLTGLTFQGSVPAAGPGVLANSGIVAIGPGPVVVVTEDTYNGFTGPTSFGSGGLHLASTGSGDFVAIEGRVGGLLFVPQGYVSGAALSSSM